MTTILNHPPLGDVLRQMEFDPDLEGLTFHPEHTLVSVLAGARCRVCARVFAPPNSPSPARFCGGAFCSQYPSDPEFRALVKLCLGMQNNVYHYRKETRPPNPLLLHRKDLTLEQKWLWDSVIVFHRACEVSLNLLGPRLRDLLAKGYGSDKGGFISHIMEMKFHPPAYYKYSHCCFLLVLKNGTEWVFDPTGVQFGPEWPLLSPYDDYMARTQSSRYPFLQFQRLGTNAERSQPLTWSRTPGT